MPIEPYQVSTPFGVRLLPAKEEKKVVEPLRPYLEAVRLERERAALRDKPAIHTGENNSAQSTMLRRRRWLDALGHLAQTEHFRSEAAAGAWMVDPHAAAQRLSNMAECGLVERVQIRPTLWRIVGAGE